VHRVASEELCNTAEVYYNQRLSMKQLVSLFEWSGKRGAGAPWGTGRSLVVCSSNHRRQMIRSMTTLAGEVLYPRVS